MRNKIFLIASIFFLFAGCKSEIKTSKGIFIDSDSLTIPAELKSYYQNLDLTLKGEELKENLAIITIAKHSRFLEYYERHQFLYEADEDPNNSRNIILIYSGESRDKSEYYSGTNTYKPQTFNTEHIYPRSLIDNTAEADLHHLRTADISINSKRKNYPFTSGSGTYKLVSNNSWYPGDEWIGDVARMIFYLNLRYNEDFESVGNLELFLEWNAKDPVSPIETQRNEIISKAQGNRNPFIDNPVLATLIWGDSHAPNRW